MTTWPYRGFGGWTEEPKLFFKRGIEGRIANGWGTKPGDYPFMARMSEEGFLIKTFYHFLLKYRCYNRISYHSLKE